MCFPTSAAKMREGVGPLEDSSPVVGLNIAERRRQAGGRVGVRANLFLLLIEDIISTRVSSRGARGKRGSQPQSRKGATPPV